MNKQEIREIFFAVKSYRESKTKSGYPHQPLALLYMLGHYWNGGERLVYFKDVCDPINDLLDRFAYIQGNRSKNDPSATYPLFRLINGKTKKIWEHRNPPQTVSPVPAEGVARRSTWQVGVSMPVYRAITNDQTFLLELVFILLNEKFAHSDHLAILHAIGVPNILPQQAKFNLQLFDCYEYRCAVCQDKSQERNELLTLEVAHIKPKFLGGHQNYHNSISMCELHKDLYHYGFFSIDEDCEIILPKKAIVELGENLTYSKTIRTPKEATQQPDPELLIWHQQNVLRQ